MRVSIICAQTTRVHPVQGGVRYPDLNSRMKCWGALGLDSMVYPGVDFMKESPVQHEGRNISRGLRYATKYIPSPAPALRTILRTLETLASSENNVFSLVDTVPPPTACITHTAHTRTFATAGQLPSRLATLVLLLYCIADCRVHGVFKIRQASCS